MNDKRQNNQMMLAFPTQAPSDAERKAGQGTESFAASHGHQSPVNKADGLMEAICDPKNVMEAMNKVIANKGAAGVDGMSVHQLREHLRANWRGIESQLMMGTYKPQPVRRVQIPKPDGSMRNLGIPTVVDRTIQQAIVQVLEPIWEATFSEHSYGFRPGRSAHQAVAKAQEYISQGQGWVVDIDLEKFFDQVNHDMLMARIARRVSDKRVLKVMRALLQAGVMENGLVTASQEGTPQGGPLSPLLSNIMLDDLDKELEARGHTFIRYADDCNIYVASPKAGERVMKSICDFITRKLKLKVNKSKSAVDRPSKRKILGFSFTSGKEPKRRISAKALDKVKAKIKELTNRNRGIDARRMVTELTTYLRGWIGYFGTCQTPSVLRDLDSRIRRRLRAVAWHQWKRGKTRFARLTARGVGHELAAQTAGSSHGPWRISQSPAMNIALPNKLWERLGLIRLESAKAT